MYTVPDLHGRVFLVTGPTSGIGRATAEALGRARARVLLACRSPEKATPLADAIRAGGGSAEVLALDLGDLASVRRCARQVLDGDQPLHVLINNAGLGGQRGITRDGFELAFGTNHLGHYLLTRLLLDRLRASSPARIVNVASGSHYQARGGIDFEILRRPTASITGLPEYAVSKLANVLFTRELARRLAGQGVESYSLHPGVVASDIWRRIPRPLSDLARLFMRSNEEGAATSLYCATSDEVAGKSGEYFDSCREKRPSRAARDEALARELWDRSEAWVADFLK